MNKFIAILALVSAASAGVVYDSAHVGAQSEQTVRGLGAFGLSTVSHQAQNVNSAFSASSSHKTKVTNPAVGVSYAAAPVAYAQPAYHAAPVAYAQPAYHAAPVAYAQPAVAKVAAPASLLGVAYSAVPQVAHLTYDTPYAHYAY